MEEGMRIGVLGSGKVGGAIGKGLARRGYPVTFASRDPSAKRASLGEALTAQVADPQQTVDASDLLVVAIPWNGLPEVLAGLKGLEGKILLDATNVLRVDGVRKLALEGSPFASGALSGGEELARLVPGARVVKAFNTIGFGLMDQPQFSQRPTMLVAGDDPSAKQTVMGLSEELGFEAMDAGPLSSAVALEALARAWVGLSFTLGRNFAFKVLR
jgi:predicted dinucleotide-binding enzyme